MRPVRKNKMTKSDDDSPLLNNIEQRIKKAIYDYRLIDDHDHILVGLSGGKDSLALVELLGRRMRIFKPHFKVTAAHISMENIGYRADVAYLKNHCEQYQIPFVHRITSFDPETDRRKSPCFLCSWYRRKTLFALAKEFGCNKIALGHHQDDILQTLLMNMTFQGAISTMPPRLKMDKFDMTLIRPLCLTPEKELVALANERGYRSQKQNCPFESSSSRPDTKEVLKLLEKMNPQARNNLWASMTRIQSDYLPQPVEEAGKRRNKIKSDKNKQD